MPYQWIKRRWLAPSQDLVCLVELPAALGRSGLASTFVDFCNGHGAKLTRQQTK